MPTYFAPGGSSVHYEEAHPTGHPPVVLLHGLGAMGESWRLQFPVLEALNFRVVAPDLPGFGWSSWPGGKVSIPRFAQLIAQFMEGVGAHPAHVVGISLGGTVALQLALDFPEMVRSLVLVNTFARLRPRTLNEWAYLLKRTLVARIMGVEKQADLVVQRIFPRPDQEALRRTLREQILRANPKVYRATMSALFRFNALPRLGEIRVPTLVVTGDQDTTVPPALQEAQLVRGIPHARHVIIPGGGHAVIADSPDAFNRVLETFYKDITRETASSGSVV